MKNNWFTKRVLPLLLMLALLIPVAVFPVNASSNVSFVKVENSAFDAHKWNLSAKKPDGSSYVDTDMVRVSVVLEAKSTISAGYATLGIAQNEAAMAYRDSLKKNQAEVTASIEKALDSKLDVAWNLTLAANIISANVQYGDIAKIEKVAGVKEVVIETQYSPAVVNKEEKVDPNMATSSSQIGSNVAWADGYTGAGSLVAIIDTGIDTDHEVFDAEAFEYAISLLEEAPELLTVADVEAVLSQLNVKGVAIDPNKTYISSKIPFAFNYIDKSYDVTHDNDSAGEHGSHVTGIAAANRFVKKNGEFVPSLESVMTQGVAPDAQIVTMKVFGKGGGAYDSDYMVAIEDAIILGCDSVNLSLGSGNPGVTTSPTYQYVLNEIAASDTVVVMSAGNAYHWANSANNGTGYLYGDDVSFATSGTPGSFAESLSVASVDNDGTTAYYYEVNGEKVFYTETSYTNKPLTTIAGEQEYVFVNGVGTDADFAAVKDVLAGKVAVCYRGTTSFFQKAEAAVANGAIATIIVNNQPGTINIDLSSYTKTQPVVSVLQSVGEVMWNADTAAVAGGVQYCTGKMNVKESIGSVVYGSDYYNMSDFSSWGLAGSLVLKPEITAPGGNIYSVNGAIAGGQSYENMSGTSMAAPQVTGMVALVAQYIRETGLAEKTGLSPRVLANSLLMSTSVPVIEADSQSYYSILKQGSGLANVGYAVNAPTYVLMGADATKSASDGKVKVELGDDPAKKGVYTFSFSINNITDKNVYYTLSADMFTQDIFAYGNNLYLDTWTALLDSDATFVVDGKEVSFGGDVQAILDYVSGKSDEIENWEALDLDGDGKITSRDAYLVAIMNDEANGEDVVCVPANGSVNVEVTLALTAAEKAYLDYYYENGAYVEAYVFANALTDSEGVKGVSHSIPVIGFYGNWTDASMYDREDYIANYYKTTTTHPYSTTAAYTQSVTAVFPGSASAVYYKGNPVANDSKYHPERNAIAYGNGGKLAKFNYTLIRNSAASRVQVKDVTTNEVVYENVSIGTQYAAYYYVNGSAWQNNNGSSKDIGWDGKNAVEGHKYVATLTMVPEYYVNGNSVDWDAAGEGASYSVPFVVDNTAPEILAITFKDGKLSVVASDNAYVAGVVLTNSAGKSVVVGADDVDGNGKIINAGIEVGEAEEVYTVQVVDYAGNSSTYRAFVNCEPTTTVEGVTISAKSATIYTGANVALKASATPSTLMSTDVIWSSSDESVAVVDAKGVVTGLSKGEAVITATAALDDTKSASCVVTVKVAEVTLAGALQDESGNPVLFEWDMQHDKTWSPYASIGTDIASAALDFGYTGAVFIQSSDGVLYAVHPATGETLFSSGAENEFGAAMWDIDFPHYFNSTNEDETLVTFGIYNGYFLMDEDLGNSFTTGWNLASYLRSYTRANKFVGLTWGGLTTDDDGAYIDEMFALTDSGYLWLLDYDGTTSIGLGYIQTNLVSKYNLTFPQYDGVQYCSLQYDDELDKLYFSYWTGSTNEIYVLEWNSSSRMFEAELIGNVGDDVWPCALLQAIPNDADDAERMANRESKISDKFNMIGTVEAVNVAADLADAVAPSFDKNEAKAASEVKVQITNDEVYATNGLVKVEYSDNLAFKNVEVATEYFSVNNDADNRVLYIAFVDVPSIAPNEIIATVTFEKVGSGSTTIVTDFVEFGSKDECPCYSLEKVEAVEATCCDDGNIEYYVCPVCGKLYADAEGTVEISIEDTVVPSAGHTSELVGAKDATCTEDGYTGDKVCSVCGEVLEKGEVVPAKGHDTELVGKKDANCVDDGYTGDVVCKVCGEVLVKGEVIAASGHSYGEYVVVSNPTLAKEGSKKATCTLCGHEDVVAIPVVSAQPADKVALPEGAIALTTAGYLHGNCVTVLAGNGEVTVGDLTALGAGSAKDMNYFAVIVVDKDGKVVAVNTTLRRPNGVKTDMVVPEGGYLIGYNANIAGYEVMSKIGVGDGITLYNIDLEAMRGVADNQAVVGAGFTVAHTHVTEIKNAKEATCTEEGYTGDEVCKVCGKIVKKGEVIAKKAHTYVDGKCECGDLLGDLNGDGKVNATDYLILKRAVANSVELDGETKQAADMNGDSVVNATDYIMLKRFVMFGKLPANEE